MRSRDGITASRGGGRVASASVLRSGVPTATTPPRAYSDWDLRQARGRVVLAFVLSAVVFFSLHALPTALRLVLAWDAAGLTLLTVSWLIIWHSDAPLTEKRAGAEDPGRKAVWLIVLLGSTFSLFASAVVLRTAKGLSPEHSAILAAACLAAVVIAWLLTHTAYALRYAHLYYRDDAEGVGGLSFPGDQAPDAFDFAYFAFTVGMCFQVSDVTVTSRGIRRQALFHACLSFAYNTAILALALNLAFGLLG